jgi:hypothetical protein
LEFNLFISKLCDSSLLTDRIFLTSATTKHWSVSQSVSLKDWISSIFDYHLLSLKMWSIWLCIIFHLEQPKLIYEFIDTGTLFSLQSEFSCSKSNYYNTIVVPIFM